MTFPIRTGSSLLILSIFFTRASHLERKLLFIIPEMLFLTESLLRKQERQEKQVQYI